jgi:hypothetical protein
MLKHKRCKLLAQLQMLSRDSRLTRTHTQQTNA